MCTNYIAPSHEHPHLRERFALAAPISGQWKSEIWKDYPAPIVRSLGTDENELCVATYGIVPRRHIPQGVKIFDTMNARAETVGEKRSFSSAWRKSQLCLIPMEAFCEPCYESGKAVRWRIGRADRNLFAVAGLWREWSEPDGSKALSFTQITINADEHPLMRRFHKPGDEKRSLVVIREEDYQSWLNCRDPEIARSMLLPFPSETMDAEAWPIPPRTKSAGTKLQSG